MTEFMKSNNIELQWCYECSSTRKEPEYDGSGDEDSREIQSEELSDDAQVRSIITCRTAVAEGSLGRLQVAREQHKLRCY